MYKIMLLRRAGDNPLFGYYRVEAEDDPDVLEIYETDDDIEIVETDDDIEIVETVRMLLNTIPRNQIKVIKDVDFEIDILLT